MNPIPTAGTFRLDGMLQGSLPGGEVDAEAIRLWLDAAAKQGLVFHFQKEGNGFSLLGDPNPRRVTAAGETGQLVEDALNSLLSFIPTPFRATMFSTIRSEEYRPGQCVQTLYAVGADGMIVREQRTVEMETASPPPELTAKSVRRLLVVGVFALLLGLCISSFFVDYRRMFAEAHDQIAPLTKEEIRVEQSALRGIVAVELKEVDNRRKVLVLDISRGPEWVKAVESAPANASNDWPTYLIHQAVHLGRLRLELIGKSGARLGDAEIDLRPLMENDHTDVIVAARLRERLAAVEVRP